MFNFKKHNNILKSFLKIPGKTHVLIIKKMIISIRVKNPTDNKEWLYLIKKNYEKRITFLS